MTKYKAKNFNFREELEAAIESELGKTTEKKDAMIVGTVAELLKVQLSHNQSVWGVSVEASDFVASAAIEKPHRGPRFKSSLNYTRDETN